MTRIALLSTSDTDLLSARSSGAEYAMANPSRLHLDELPGLLTRADLVVVRLLGSVRSWQDGFDVVLGSGLPVVVLGGEQTPDAELMSHSTVPVGTAAEAHRYLAEGGPVNLANLHAFLSDTVLLTGEGFDPPAVLPAWGWAERSASGANPNASGAEWRDTPSQNSQNAPLAERARVGVLYYRAHEASGNSGFAHTLADAIDATGEAVGVPIFSSSLRSAPDDLYEALGTLDALIVTVLAAGGTTPGSASAGGDDEAWDVERMKALDIPILQGLCLTSSREEWEASDEGVTPLDSANQIAIPEFDGRIITAPFSFKEIDEDGLPRYVADRRALRPGGRHRRQPRAVAPRAAGRAQGRADAVGVPHQAQPGRQRGRPRHPGLGHPAAPPHARRGLRPRSGRRRGHPLPRDVRRHRRPATRSSTPSSPPAARTRSGSPRPSSPTATSGSVPTTTADGRRISRLSSWTTSPRRGAKRPASCSSTTRTRSCSPPCRPATSSCSSSHLADSARTRSRSTTTPTSPRRTTTSPHTAGSSRGSARMPSFTSASTARWSGCRARTRHSRRRADPTRRSATCRSSTRSSSTTRARARRPSVEHTPRSSTTSCRRWRGPSRTATSPGSSSCSTSTPTSPRWTRPSCRPSAPRSGPSCTPPRCIVTSGSTSDPTTRSSTTSSSTSTAGSARSRTPRSATACTCSARHPMARPGSTWCSRSCARRRSGAASPEPCPDCAPRSGWATTQQAAPSTPSRPRRDHWSSRWKRPAGSPALPTTSTPTRPSSASCASPPSRWCRGSTPPPTSSTPCCTPSAAASSPPGRRAHRCAAS